LYGGTDIGVFYRDEQLSEWIDYSGNLPNVIVNDLEIDYGTSMLKAATYGRGIWQAPIRQVNQEILRAEFSLSQTNGCVNGIIMAEDHSLGDPTGYHWNFGEGAIPSTANTKGPHAVYYTTTGEKNISLTVSGVAQSDTETKTGMLDIGISIDFVVFPDKANMCNGPVTIYTTGNYPFTWSPPEGLNTTAGNKVVASPEHTAIYTVTATHGACIAQKEIAVIVTDNDNICNAVSLHYGVNGPFNNDCATAEENEPVPPATGCFTQNGWCEAFDKVDNSLWFTFEASETGMASINSDGFDNQIAVYSASSCADLESGNYILLAANDNYFFKKDNSAGINGIGGLAPGQTYWVQVDGGSFDGESGTFYLNLNDDYMTGFEETPTDPDQSIEVFPNPSRTGLFNLRMEGNYDSGLRLFIRNISGDILHQADLPSYSSRTLIPLNLSCFHSGIYILEIHAENGIHYR